ncbi:MAG TPA: FHA domain-containing protein [Solirubrobacteraceae bacterium]|nr:FHA domain-containing protein [Solirubrobacteraceae bacterium]
MNSAMARLEVVAGRAIGMWILIDDELLIGRHAEGAGRLADDEEISRSHARLSLDRTGFCAIEDLGSTNGTYVNGLRITGPETLSEGDTIEVGATTLVVRELPIPHSEHTHRAIPSRPTVIPGSALAPAPDKTPPAGRHHVRASEAGEQSAARAAQQAPVTTESAGSKPARPSDKKGQITDNLSLKLEIDWDAHKATVSVGDEKPLRFVLEGDTWHPASDAG